MSARFAIVALAAAAAGCASAPRTPIDLPPNPSAPLEPQGWNIQGDAVALSFSGGGARAAAFSLGVLQGLRETPAPDGRTQLDHVVFVSGVSGGAITAAYFGQHGAEGLDNYRAAYLDRDWDKSFHTSPFSPANWVRVLHGGLNDSAALANWLDENMYQGGKIADLWAPGHPRVLLNATDLYSGAPFAFSQPYFDAACSDLASLRIADAVAASMAVPVAFHPVAITTHPALCVGDQPDWIAKSSGQGSQLTRVTANAFTLYRDPKVIKYVHLVDGGVADNLGLSALMAMRAASASKFAPLSDQDAVRVRNLTFVVVNAEMIRDAKWPMSAQGPNGVEAASAALDDAMDSAKRGAYDTFAAMVNTWQSDVRAYRCGLKDADVIRLRGSLTGWKCDDVHFTASMIAFADLPASDRDKLGIEPTRVSLPATAIDALIAGGKTAVKLNPAIKAAAQ